MIECGGADRSPNTASPKRGIVDPVSGTPCPGWLPGVIVRLINPPPNSVINEGFIAAPVLALYSTTMGFDSTVTSKLAEAAAALRKKAPNTVRTIQ